MAQAPDARSAYELLFALIDGLDGFGQTAQGVPRLMLRLIRILALKAPGAVQSLEKWCEPKLQMATMPQDPGLEGVQQLIARLPVTNSLCEGQVGGMREQCKKTSNQPRDCRPGGLAMGGNDTVAQLLDWQQTDTQLFRAVRSTGRAAVRNLQASASRDSTCADAVERLARVTDEAHRRSVARDAEEAAFAVGADELLLCIPCASRFEYELVATSTRPEILQEDGRFSEGARALWLVLAPPAVQARGDRAKFAMKRLLATTIALASPNLFGCSLTGNVAHVLDKLQRFVNV